MIIQLSNSFWVKYIQNLKQSPFPKFIKTGKLYKDSNNLLKWNLTGKDPV